MPSHARTVLYPAYKHPPPGGHRKTARRQGPRRPAAALPPWRASFILAPNAVLCPGPVALVGATVSMIGACIMGEVEGRDRDWTLRQLDKLASALGYDHRPLYARVTREAQSALTIAAPYQRGDDCVVALYDRYVVEGGAMRTLCA